MTFVEQMNKESERDPAKQRHRFLSLSLSLPISLSLSSSFFFSLSPFLCIELALIILYQTISLSLCFSFSEKYLAEQKLTQKFHRYSFTFASTTNLIHAQRNCSVLYG